MPGIIGASRENNMDDQKHGLEGGHDGIEKKWSMNFIGRGMTLTHPLFV